MEPEQDLINRCINNDPVAQELLYRRYASKMFGVCMRYAANKMEAEDILQEGFIKIFTNLSKYRGEGSFEGWIRRTMVNTAINHYYKNIKFLQDIDIDEVDIVNFFDQDAISNLSEAELLKLIQELPEGYRMVFNLYVIEGYSHKEIAEQLGITENTSKSQLSRARAALQNKIRKLYNINFYEQSA
ncbi:MAG TPA: sigma-70 family RNA polymerase sigma factor [Bacteroidales bacterium]|nr:sigma-70 family RNA polymerase sigma factor [Bacteroidales bacterium]